MRPRFPLYAKILAWFFLNLVVLAVAFVAVLGGQFRFQLDWLLSGSAGVRVDAMTDLILSELRSSRRGEWDEALARFGAAYRLNLYLFRNDGLQVAGEKVELPSPVRQRLTEREPGRPPPPMRERRGDRFPREGEFEPPPPPGPAAIRAPGARSILRTTDPVRYWLMVRTRLDGPEGPARATLIGLTPSISGGGLFFDPWPWVGAVAGAAVLSALLWLPFVRGVTRSLSQMTEATQRIAEGRFDVRLEERRADELGALGGAINQMAARLDGFVKGQKRFLGDIAHELCSPLARLRIALGILEQRTGVDQQRYVASANEKAAQIADLVNELLSFSKASLGPATLRLEAVPLRPVAETAARRESGEDGRVEIDIAPDLRALGEPELLTRALANLLRNAIRYAGNTGPIRVGAVLRDGAVVLTVTDRGPGIPESELSKVFDPFYRIDPSRDRETGGVGLGLAIVKTCVEACGGRASVRNLTPHGLEVELSLTPAPATEPAPVTQADEPDRSAGLRPGSSTE